MADLAGIDLVDLALVNENDLENVTGCHLGSGSGWYAAPHIIHNLSGTRAARIRSMALKLRVISDHYKALGKRSSRLFGVTGGKIGRAQDNDWILPDPDRYVSSHHCKVDFRAGRWILEDTSTNGVFINGSDTPASVEGAYTLHDGDRLRLGDYEVLVSIDERNDFAADESGQIPAPPRVRNKSAVKTHPRATDNDLGEELDLTDLISDSAIAPAPIMPPPRRAPSSSSLDLESALALDSDDLKAMGPIPATPAPA